jgi:hypothetical protein
MPVNPVLESAMESLSLVISLSTGRLTLLGAQDRAHANHHFAILHEGGEAFEPGEVVAWAASHGWEPEAARELGEIAQAIRKQPRGRRLGKSLQDNVLLEWRRAAAYERPAVERTPAPRLLAHGDVAASEL